MRVRFWGTRGSIATPGPGTLRYGGNTACVEVRLDDGTLIILDCGTGARALGQALLASGEKPLRGHIIITHTHWDHIQGFPFFAPLFIPGNEWDIYAPGVTGRRLEDTLAGQMEYTYFPVRLDQLGATIRYHDVVEGTFSVGSARITAHYLNHPALTLGYRIEAGGASLVYATDHEPHSHHRLDLPAGASKIALMQPVHQEDRRHVQFIAGADLVIHDAQFTAAEDQSRIGWGHTAAEQVVDFALAAGIERLALFHHDPSHDDDVIDGLVEACRMRAIREAFDDEKSLEITAAAEGRYIDLSEDPEFLLRPQVSQWEPSAAPQNVPVNSLVGPERARTANALGGMLAGEAPSWTAREETVLIVDGPEGTAKLAAALEPEAVRLLTASDLAAIRGLAESENPDLVLIGNNLSEIDPLQACRALRSDGQSAPILLLTARLDADTATATFDAGASDHLAQPFTPAQIRARVRLWLQRHRQSVNGAASAIVRAQATLA